MPSHFDDDSHAPSITLAIGPAGDEMYRRYRTAQYASALSLAEAALAVNPSDSLAWAVRTACKVHLGAGTHSPDGGGAGDLDIEIEVDVTALQPESSNTNDTRREMYRRFWDSDYPAALEMAEASLQERPEDPMALAIAEESRIALDLRRSIPVARLDSEIPYDMEPRARLMLSRVDGFTSIGEIVEELGVPPPEAQRVFESFAAAGLIHLFR